MATKKNTAPADTFDGTTPDIQRAAEKRAAAAERAGVPAVDDTRGQTTR